MHSHAVRRRSLPHAFSGGAASSELWSARRTRMGRTSLGAILLCCIPGLSVLWFAARSADALRHELATWPRVQAHVDSATIAE